MKKIPLIAAAAVLLLVGSAPAFANSSATSGDKAHGAKAVFASVNDTLQVIDEAYDGWGAESLVNSGNTIWLCIDGGGYNTSNTCSLQRDMGKPKGTAFLYKACLEHSGGAILSDCSATISDKL